ncbi:Peptidylprolyl isomerase [Aphelenchoides fujianensis]|nr:Peptidylprolyl isomerase [Aphelenchoides fujianensis]
MASKDEQFDQQDLSKDGGVLKTIKRAGSSDKCPAQGDTVYVHYTGTLASNGEKFDSSRDRSEPFSFALGKGQVIKAWDLGVSTMKQGERCELVCRADYAYGPSGSPPKIPADATLKFDIELLRFEGEDISPDRDGTITKSIIEEGEKYNCPSENATVKVHAVGTHEGRVFYDKELGFILGEGSAVGLPKGVERAIRAMELGEKIRLHLTGMFAYGLCAPPDSELPPMAEVVFTIELKSFKLLTKPEFFCKLCTLPCENKHNYDEHCKGDPHKKMAKAAEAAASGGSSHNPADGNLGGSGTNMGLQLAQLHAQTGCVLSIADVGDPAAFNPLRVVGKIDRELDAMDRFVSFIPDDCGIHLNREWAFMSGVLFREHCKQLLEQMHAADRPNVVVHFATDQKAETWAVFCVDAHALKTVASSFAQRIAPKDGPHLLHSFLACALRGQEKPWFLSGPRASAAPEGDLAPHLDDHPQSPRCAQEQGPQPARARLAASPD